MKNKCRIIALLLAAALMTVYGLPAAYADKGGMRTSPDTSLLTAIGVYDESAAQNASSEQAVTRAEAAYYALLLSGADKNSFSGLYEPIFTDVPQTHKYAGAISMAVSLRIVSKDLIFQPDKHVTVNEMTKMLVSVLGYHSFAQLNGGYPAGYLMVASKQGLFGGIAASGEDTLTFRDMTVMLNNALHADYMEQVSAGDKIDFQTQNGVTLLSKRFHIYDGVGQITQNSITALNSDEGLGNGRIAVGGHICNITDEVLYAQLTRYIGYEGTYYIREEDGDKTLVHFLPDRSDVTTIFSEDFNSYENGTIAYSASNGSLKKLKLAPSAAVIYNGKAITEGFDQTLLACDWGEIRVVKNSGTPDVVIVNAYENYVVSAVDKENYIVYDDTVSGRKLDFEKDGKLSTHAYFRFKTGETLSFDKIVEGMVLTAAVSRERDYFDIIVVTETVSGNLQSIETEDVDGVTRVKTVVLDANEYEVAYSSSRLAQLMLGNKYTFRLDAGGRIASVILDSSPAGGYVFLIDAKKSNAGVGDKVQFRILNNNGNVEVLDAAKKIQIDGTGYKSETDGEKILAVLSVDGTEQGAIYSQVAEIIVNENSEITDIDTAMVTEKEDEQNSLQSIYEASEELYYRTISSETFFQARFGTTNSTKVFFYPRNTKNAKIKGTDKEYGVSGVDYFKSGVKYAVQAFAHTPSSPVAEVITVEGKSDLSAASQDYIMVVDRVSKALSEDGEEKILLSGFYQGTTVQLYIDDASTLLINAETGKKSGAGSARTVTIEKGDAVWFGKNMEGYVNEIELLYDCSEKHSYAENSGMDEYVIAQVVCGPLYQTKDGFLTLCKNAKESPDAETNPKRHFISNGYKIYVVEQQGKDVNVRIGSTMDLKDYYTYHDDCSTVLLQMRYYEPRTMIIYQK